MHEKLLKYENGINQFRMKKYYNLIKQWLSTPDDLPAYETCIQVKCAPSNAWLEDVKGINSKPTAQLSINHYMAMRFILFVLFDLPCKATGGKIQSDGDARKEMLAEFPDGHPLLEAYAKLVLQNRHLNCTSHHTYV